MAYAMWPSAEAREAAFDPGVLQLHPAVGEMLACVEEIVVEIHLTVSDDLLLSRLSSEADD